MSTRFVVLALSLAACSNERRPPAPMPRVGPVPFVASTPVPAASTPGGPPVAATRPVTETLFGSTVTDAYRWMEADSPERAAWLEGQAKFARATLEALPERAALLARIEQLGGGGDEVSKVYAAAGKTFYLRRARGAELARLVVRDGVAGAERVLVDPMAQAAASTHFAIDDYSPSPDGKRVAYKISPNGSETGELRVVDVATGTSLPDSIDREGLAGISWIDGRRFLHSRLRKLPPDAPQSERFKGILTYIHTLGDDPERDPAVFGPGVSPSVTMADDDFALAVTSDDGRTAFGLVFTGSDQTIFAAPTATLGRPGAAWTKIADASRDKIGWIESHGGDLYLLSHRDAPRFRIVKTPIAHPDVEHATVVVPESDRVISGIAAASDALYVSALDAGIGRLLRLPYRGGPATTIQLPFDGTLGQLSVDPKGAGVTFELSSWVVSARRFFYDPKSAKVVDTGLATPSPVDFSTTVAEETQVKEADGTSVPLSIVHSANFAADGSHPTWLRVYGAYGRSELPEFQPTLLAWLERGGVYAVCHARGGGERGEAWHEDGMLLRKQHTVDDMLACAQALIDRKITSAGRLAAEGTSAGAVAAGAAINQRPELFGAALLLVGLTNTLRLEQSENVFNVAEFGTVQTKEGLDALRGADVVANVKDGTRYPAVLLTAGMNDPRVAAWMQMKTAARLQAATTSGKPVLLRVDFAGGHVEGATRRQEDETLADTYAFLLAQLGAR